MSNVPMNDVPKPSRTFPTDFYDVTIESIQKGATSKAGWLEYSFMYRMENNAVYFERFLCGTEKDKEGKDPATWTSKDRRVRGMGVDQLCDTLRKAKVPGNTVEECMKNAPGHRLTLSILAYDEPATKKKRQADGTLVEVPNEFAGMPKNRVTARYELGGGRKKAPLVQAASAAAQAPVQYIEEKD